MAYLSLSVQFKDRIKQWRMERELRQKEAAAKVDIPVATWRNYEKGKRTPNKLAMSELERRMATIAL